MTKLTNKIEAHDRSVNDVLDDNKYTVDYFQREYKWEARHVEQLVTDLAAAFIQENRPEHQRRDVANYNSYYLGPFVVSNKDGKRSIIDGQQRLTTLTLFLIYLNNLQKQLGYSERLEPLIFSEKYGERSFNLDVEERLRCMESLFKNGEYIPSDDDDESTMNMSRRYEEIDSAFPEELKDDSLPFFIDWLKYNVVLVEIVAYSDENAYTIFETMNDRGLNLTPTEMLKSYILSRFKDPKQREKANQHWKSAVQDLMQYNKDEDQRFIQAWFRGHYAESIRQGKEGAKNEDFEQIGTRFHHWFRENLPKMKLDIDRPDEFERFVNEDFKFYKNAYIIILEAEQKLNLKTEHVYYSKICGIAASLRHPLYMSALTLSDSPDIIQEKIDTIGRYIETFAIRRAINFKKYSASSIRYTMYSLVKELRRKSISEIKSILKNKLSEIKESWNGFEAFYMHGQNHWLIKYLLSRITSCIDQLCGNHTSFDKYYYNPGGKQFEVEHIWSQHFEEHREEFDQKQEFDKYRNHIGAMLLLPRGSNQSYGAKPYIEKLKHYVKENVLAQSLCDLTYENNPNFVNMIKDTNLPFKPCATFTKKDIDERQKLMQAICEKIWDESFFN